MQTELFRPETQETSERSEWLKTYPYKYSLYWCREGEVWHRNSLFSGYNDNDYPEPGTQRFHDCPTIERVKEVIELSKTEPFTHTICTKLDFEILLTIPGVFDHR